MFRAYSGRIYGGSSSHDIAVRGLGMARYGVAI